MDSMDYLMFLLICAIYGIPYDSLIETIEVLMKIPAVKQLKDKLDANRNGVYTPIKAFLVDDAIDVAKKGIEKCIRDMHAAMPEELIQMELDKSEQNAEMIKAAMKKQLADTGILEK